MRVIGGLPTYQPEPSFVLASSHLPPIIAVQYLDGCGLAGPAATPSSEASVWSVTVFEQLNPLAAIERSERRFDPERFA